MPLVVFLPVESAVPDAAVRYKRRCGPCLCEGDLALRLGLIDGGERFVPVDFWVEEKTDQRRHLRTKTIANEENDTGMIVFRASSETSKRSFSNEKRKEYHHQRSKNTSNRP